MDIPNYTVGDVRTQQIMPNNSIVAIILLYLTDVLHFLPGSQKLAGRSPTEQQTLPESFFDKVIIYILQLPRVAWCHGL
jgi:hypothetical protein